MNKRFKIHAIISNEPWVFDIKKIVDNGLTTFEVDFNQPDLCLYNELLQPWPMRYNPDTKTYQFVQYEGLEEDLTYIERVLSPLLLEKENHVQ